MTSVVLMSVLVAFAGKLLFACEALLCQLIDVLYQCFEAFAGIRPVAYLGKSKFLINVFFENKVISTIYWGMAGIGFAMLFGFAIVSVIKKIFDSTGEKVKATYGMILTNCFKSILLILLMTAIVSASIDASGVLMRSVDYLFNNAESIANPDSIEFDNADFATMNRIYNTIGNYSLNPSYDNRFNINACFNDIEQDMQILDDKGVFNFTYARAQNGEDPEATWQRILLNIYTAQDIYEPIPIDAYNEALIAAMKEAMYQIKVNEDFKPLQKYAETGSSDSLGTTIGRTIMLTASFGNAKQPKYDESPSVVDGLRRPYYTGEKNIYSYDQAESDFEIGIFSWNHIVALVVSYFVLKEMLIILINSVARIFNIILLYITSPGFLAVMPLDDGGKMKQWTMAYVIQSLSLFGSVFAVRLLMIFLPMVMSSDLQLFESSFANGMGKLAFLIGICVTSEKANGLITGILADNAGYQSIMAGDVGGGTVGKALSLGGRFLGSAAKAGWKLGTGTLGAASDATGLSTRMNKLAEKTGINKLSNLGQSMRDKGGIVSAFRSGLSTNEAEKKAEDQQKKDAEASDTKDFRSSMMNAVKNLSGGGGGVPGGGESGGGIQNLSGNRGDAGEAGGGKSEAVGSDIQNLSGNRVEAGKADGGKHEAVGSNIQNMTGSTGGTTQIGGNTGSSGIQNMTGSTGGTTQVNGDKGASENPAVSKAKTPPAKGKVPNIQNLSEINKIIK